MDRTLISKLLEGKTHSSLGFQLSLINRCHCWPRTRGSSNPCAALLFVSLASLVIVRLTLDISANCPFTIVYYSSSDGQPHLVVRYVVESRVYIDLLLMTCQIWWVTTRHAESTMTSLVYILRCLLDDITPLFLPDRFCCS